MTGAHECEIRIEIDAHHLAPFFGRQFLDAARGGEDAGVQYDHVEPAVGASSLLERASDRGLIGDVTSETQKVVATMQRLDRRIDDRVRQPPRRVRAARTVALPIPKRRP